jgi:6-phosphogluconolactonase
VGKIFFFLGAPLRNVRVFPDPDAMAEALALRLKEEADRAVNEKRVCSVVLSGGETVAKVYRKLSAPGLGEQIPWQVVHLFWADERCVFPESKESNFGIAHRTFLKSISIPDENIHRIRGEAEPLSESVRYGQEIKNHMALRRGKKFFFDWVLLGVGVDGHTASLFPMHETSLRSQNLCEEVQHPQTGQKRITLTPFALKRSANITYHVIGEEKSLIVPELVSNIRTSRYPVTQIPGEFYLDQSAASKLNIS